LNQQHRIFGKLSANTMQEQYLQPITLYSGEECMPRMSSISVLQQC